MLRPYGFIKGIYTTRLYCSFVLLDHTQFSAYRCKGF